MDYWRIKREWFLTHPQKITCYTLSVLELVSQSDYKIDQFINYCSMQQTVTQI